jgi:hypothetical protein
MLMVLGGLAEFEHELIRRRTTKGRERAKAKGVIMGRKPLTHHQRQEAVARHDAGEALVDIARSYNVSHSRSAGWSGRHSSLLSALFAFQRGYKMKRLAEYLFCSLNGWPPLSRAQVSRRLWNSR